MKSILVKASFHPILNKRTFSIHLSEYSFLYLRGKILALIKVFEPEGIVADELDILVLCYVTLAVIPERTI